MVRIVVLLMVVLFSSFSSVAQSIDMQNKSKEELIQFIKESIETYGNLMGMGYKVSYAAEEPNHLRIAEEANGDLKWYKVDLSQAKMGSSISILASGKENFILTFKKEIAIKEKNQKNATLDVFFYRKKEKRETDYSDLIENITTAFTLLLPKCKAL